MKTATDLIKELGVSRLEQIKIKKFNDEQHEIRDVEWRKSFWASLINIVSEVSDKYPENVCKVQILYGREPYFLFKYQEKDAICKYDGTMYFNKQDGMVSLQYRENRHDNNRWIAVEARTIDQLIPALISVLTDIVHGLPINKCKI